MTQIFGKLDAFPTQISKETAMAILKLILALAIMPGDRFCAMVGASPQDDSGMLRGFINSIFWGAVLAIILFNVA